MGRYVIAGIAGCIGTWVAKVLQDAGHEVLGVDLAGELPNAKLVGVRDVPVERLDVTDGARFAAYLEEAAPDGIVHLVSMLMPSCKANPEACVDINVRSFMTVLESARKLGASVAYASSAWVQTPPPDDRLVTEDYGLTPQSLYGVFKLANEGQARMYAKDFEVKVNGLRPFIVYGPGRVGGLTADINLALLAAAEGKPYEIGFGGSVALHHALDVATTFARLVTNPVASGRVYNVRGTVASMGEIVAVIEKVTGTSGLVTYHENALPIAANLSDAALQRDYGPVAFLSLEEGMRQTVGAYRVLGVG